MHKEDILEEKTRRVAEVFKIEGIQFCLFLTPHNDLPTKCGDYAQAIFAQGRYVQHWTLYYVLS